MGRGDKGHKRASLATPGIPSPAAMAAVAPVAMAAGPTAAARASTPFRAPAVSSAAAGWVPGSVAAPTAIVATAGAPCGPGGPPSVGAGQAWATPAGAPCRRSPGAGGPCVRAPGADGRPASPAAKAAAATVICAQFGEGERGGKWWK